jgi:hypothetical protein
MSATRDPLDRMMFKTAEEAQAHCEKHGFDAVIELDGPAYADKPYICVKYVSPDEKLPEGAVVGKVGDE